MQRECMGTHCMAVSIAWYILLHPSTIPGCHQHLTGSSSWNDQLAQNKAVESAGRQLLRACHRQQMASLSCLYAIEPNTGMSDTIGDMTYNNQPLDWLLRLKSGWTAVQIPGRGWQY